MNTEQERAAFEAFASKHGLCITEDGDLYRSHVVAWMWKAWQARAALQSQPLTVDAMAQEIRRVNGNNALGAGALAEALMPFLESALQSQEYTAAIGEAGQAYLDKFKNAHALPAEFRWSELWAVMCVAANTGRTDATQSQDREDAERYRRLRKGDIDNVAVVRGLGAMDYGASAVVATYSEEIDGDDLDTTIDHARRAEGEL